MNTGSKFLNTLKKVQEGNYSFSGKSLNKETLCNGLIILITLFLFFLMPILSQDYGVSGDEYVDHRHTGYVMDYFFKGDTKALNQPKTLLHYYGISAQVIVRGVIDMFGIQDYYEARHAMCSIFGVLTILLTGLLARRVGGGVSGVIAMLMLFLVPRFLGHSMNNLKDIPFALGYVFSIFYIIKLFDNFPRFKKRDVIFLSLGIAFTIGNRAGGLLLIPYLFMYAGLFYIETSGGIKEFFRFKRHAKILFRILAVVVIVSVIGYFASVLLWPYALENPIKAPVESLKLLTKFKMGIRQIFEGKQVMSNLLPKYYAPKYLLITLPLTVLSGFTIYLVTILFTKRKVALTEYFLLFTAIFPVFWVVYKNSNLYGGIRHFMFVIPIFVVLASIAWKDIIARAKSSKIKYALIAVLLILFFLPLRWVIISHPDQYIYFNEIEGGIGKAYGNYEMDYYFNSEKRGVEWIRENVKNDTSEMLIVASHGKPAYYLRNDKNLKGIYTRYYERGKKDWDYAVFVNEYINRYQLKRDLFPPKGTVKVFELEGRPMCAVVKRPSKDDYYGFKAIKEKRYDDALKHFKNYLKIDDNSEQAWLGLSQSYFFKKDFNNALASINKSLSLHPDYISSMHMKCMIFYERGEYQKALAEINKILAKRKIADVMLLKASIYYKMKRYKASIQVLNVILKSKPSHIKALNLAGEILLEKRDYKQAIKVYSRMHKKYSMNKEILYKLSKAYARSGDLKSAYYYLRKLAALDKAYFPGAKLQVELLIIKSKYDDASKILKTLMAKVSNDAELYFLSGLLQVRQGKYKQAVKSLNKSLSIKKDYKEAKQLLNKVSSKKI